MLQYYTQKFCGRRHQGLTLIYITLLCMMATLLKMAWWFTAVTSAALRPPPPMAHKLHHLRRNNHLKSYLDNMMQGTTNYIYVRHQPHLPAVHPVDQRTSLWRPVDVGITIQNGVAKCHRQLIGSSASVLLIQPSSTKCEGVEDVPLIVLVSSHPSNIDQRYTIRSTWGKHQPTYFVIGMASHEKDVELVNNYIEAKEWSDMVLFEFEENYQNLTLKTALMLQWSQRRCPQAQAVLKTDDDVLINPWRMKEVLADSDDKQLIGYKMNDSYVHRDEYNKWYMPRWLYPQDVIPEYLSGPTYIISGEYLDKIMRAAYRTSLINLEDVYFTGKVASSVLHLTLSHDRRLSIYKPWFRSGCGYWGLATAHSVSPDEMASAWTKIVRLANKHEDGQRVCLFFSFLFSDMFLY